MPRLSILIPAFGAFDSLEQTLVSVLRNRPSNCEVIALTTEQYADPYELSDEVRFLVAPAGASRSAALNEAFVQCNGAVIHTLSAGSEVVEGWTEAAIAHFDDCRLAIVAPLALDAAAVGRALSAGSDYRPWGAASANCRGATVGRIGTRPFAVTAATHLAAFYRAAALSEVGRFDLQLDGDLAEVDLGLRLAKAGYTALCEPGSRMYCPRSAEMGAAGVRQFAYQAERTFWRHAAAQGWAPSLAAHGLALVAELLSGVVAPATLARRIAGRAQAAAETLLGRQRRSTAPVSPNSRPSQERPRGDGTTLRTDPPQPLRRAAGQVAGSPGRHVA